MKDFSLAKFIASFFYLGCFPFAAGSLASLAGALFWAFWGDQRGLYLIVLTMAVFLGFLTGGRVERALGHKDPSCVVMDEFAGVLIAFFALPFSPAVFWITFFLFRAFDMFKIYPANKFEAANGSAGIMMDDIVAGLYTNIVMQVAIFLLGVQ